MLATFDGYLRQYQGPQSLVAFDGQCQHTVGIEIQYNLYGYGAPDSDPAMKLFAIYKAGTKDADTGRHGNLY